MYEQLKTEYIASVTKGWDKETFDKYVSNVEEDFQQWYKGYEYAMKELQVELLPILQFANGKIQTDAGIFEQTLERVILKLKSF